MSPGVSPRSLRRTRGSVNLGGGLPVEAGNRFCELVSAAPSGRQEMFQRSDWAYQKSIFEIVCCRWAGADEVEHHSLILCHPKMTNTLWLGEKAAAGRASNLLSSNFSAMP
jgi:hypothetical protein